MPWCQVTGTLLGTPGNDAVDLHIAAVWVLCAHVDMQHVMHTTAMGRWEDMCGMTAQCWFLYSMWIP